MRRSVLAVSFATRSAQPATFLSTAISGRRDTGCFFSGGAVGYGRRAVTKLERGWCSSLTAVTHPARLWVHHGHGQPLRKTRDSWRPSRSTPPSAGVLGGRSGGGMARRGIWMSAAAESSSAVVDAADTGVVGREDGSNGPSGECGMKVTLLSGFLGAGKTTLMQNVIRQAKEERLSLAVIVNDMADVNIDAQILGLKGNKEESGGSPSAAPAAGAADVTAVSTVADDAMVAMDGGCICCTLKDDLLREVEAIARRGKHQHLIIESTGISDPMPVAEALVYSDHDEDHDEQDADSNGGVVPVAEREEAKEGKAGEGEGEGELFSVDTLVTVVDSTSFLDEVRAADYLEDRGMESQEGDTRTIADLLITQVEFANVILLNKADLAAEADLVSLEAVVRKLNPAAKVVRTVSSDVGLAEILGTGVFDLDEASQAAGWVQALNGEEAHASPVSSRQGAACYDGGDELSHSDRRAPRGEEDHGGGDARGGASSGSSKSRSGGGLVADIGSFTFRAERPFHPERLMGFVMEHLPSVLRSKGFLWLATRNDETGVWTQAGGSFATEYGGPWDNDEEDRGGGEGKADTTHNEAGQVPGERLAASQAPQDGQAVVSVGSGGAGDSEAANDVRDDVYDDEYDADSNIRRTELVFIGLGMDDDALKAELERCLLTEDEMAGGPKAWSERFEDPFPPWH
eukprot:g13098.t1